MEAHFGVRVVMAELGFGVRRATGNATKNKGGAAGRRGPLSYQVEGFVGVDSEIVSRRQAFQEHTPSTA